MTSVPYERLFLPSETPVDLVPEFKKRLNELPNLGAFSVDPWDSRASTLGAHSSADALFRIVEAICGAHGFWPIVGELAYLSDPVFRGELEIQLNSFTAADTEQRSFSLPKGIDPSIPGRPAYKAPYFRAIERMLQSEGGHSPEPIAGHPSLWQDSEDWPRIGYVTFPTAAAGRGAAPFNIAHFPEDEFAFERPMEVSEPQTSKLEVDVEKFSRSADAAFERFVGYFIEEARMDAEAVPHHFARPFNRLLSTSFLGVPFVRGASDTDPTTARRLAGLRLAPARGAMLLLFLKPVQERANQNLSLPGDADSARLDRIAQALHMLLSETGLKEAAERARQQRSLLHYLTNIVHDAGNLVRAVQPAGIWQAVSSGDDVFREGNWDWNLFDHKGNRAPDREAMLIRTFEGLEATVDLAQGGLALLEFRGKGGILVPKYTAAQKPFGKQEGAYTPLTVRSVVDRAAEILRTVQTGALKGSHPIEILWRPDAEDVEVPAAYLAPTYIVPVIYEALLNCAKHGLPSGERVPVTIGLKTSKAEVMADDSDLLICEIEFSNPMGTNAPQQPYKYQSFLEEIEVVRDLKDGEFILKIIFRPFQIYDEEVRQTGQWASLRRRDG